MAGLNFGFRCITVLLVTGNVLQCIAVLPPYLPILQQGNVKCGDIIESYFHLGMNYKEILLLIGLTHGFYLSMRQLKRILKSRGLGRWINHSELQEYKTEGPNHLWHIDEYDKLKPFGFCIHGGIDGYSRRIMWLEVGPSNNDPFIVAQYCIDCVRQIGGTPRLIRPDNGTENVNIAAVQRFFQCEENSFLYDMRDSGMFCDADVLQCECLKFCLMQVLRDELYKFAEQWNLHRMRPSTNVESPSGRPDILYFLPEINGVRNLITVVSLDDVEIAEQRCCNRPPETGCTDEFCELASVIMQEKNIEMPKTAEMQ
ncbi:hypothetical protein P5673_024448 [Acropora cervicornis]|uniref:Integrase core domain-containing protein n=1 Tax=Acropora cervicornis TaxID=6130 RepID=A0AAD9UY81_ACRCE|nr:hypothetical protein P5673_024448 [Acropora cervicornis]